VRATLLPGIVIAAGKTKAKATRLAVQCKTCRSMKHIALGGGFSGVQVPRVCDQSQAAPDQSAEGGCGVDPFVVGFCRSNQVDP
jgi:DNA replication licensing factor MCM5